MWLAGELLTRLGQHLAAVRLVPGGHGLFDIRVDGEKVMGHEHRPDQHYFPDAQELLPLLYQRLGITPDTTPHR